MNEDKVKELLEELKDGINNPRIIVPTFDGSDDEEIENDKLLSPNDCKVLLDYITKLQNNWNELKKYIDENKLVLQNPQILDFYLKMQELEQVKDE